MSVSSDSENNTKSNPYNDNENSNDESEFDYEISISADKKTIFSTITEIKNVKNPKSISSIQIRLSELSSLKGIGLFQNLVRLDLSKNKIASLDNCGFHSLTKLNFLDVSCNKLNSLDGIEDLVALRELNASHNKISSLSPFSRFSTKRALKTLNIKGNLISDLKEFDFLVNFTSLTKLVLSEGNDTNPICNNANCNDYIHSVLNNGSAPRNNPSDYHKDYQSDNRYAATSFEGINRKHFMTGISNQPTLNQNEKFVTRELYKNELKNYQMNIQDLYRDQKNLIFKYETDRDKWSTINRNLQDNINHFAEENKTLKARALELENSNSKLKKNLETERKSALELKSTYIDKENEAASLIVKLAQIKKDYELTLIDKTKLIELNKSQTNQISELKSQLTDQKYTNEKTENYYKDLVEKKNSDINDRNRNISLLETKIYDVTKSIADKQKEIEKLIETNNTLQTTIVKLNKEKGEFEFEMNKRIEKEMQDQTAKYKASVEEMEKKYTTAINSKSEECLNDIKSLEKHYESLIEDANSKIDSLAKENDKLKFSLEECKSLLKISLEKEEKNETVISELKANLDKISSELNLSLNRNKNFENELKDLHNIIIENEKVIEKSKVEYNNLKTDYNLIIKERSSAENELKNKEEVINDLLSQINDLKNQNDITQLNEMIKTKTLLADDQSNQIIALNEQIENLKNKNEKASSKISSMTKELNSLSKLIKEKDECIGQYENQIVENENSINELNSKVAEKEELIRLIQEEVGNIKSEISSDKAKISNSNEKINDLINENSQMKMIIETQKDDNIKLINYYENTLKENFSISERLSKENDEMKNELRYIITEYEKLKAQNEKYANSFMQFTQMMNSNLIK